MVIKYVLLSIQLIKLFVVRVSRLTRNELPSWKTVSVAIRNRRQKMACHEKKTNETREASKKDTEQAHYGSCQLSHAFLHLTFAWSEMNLMRVEVNFKHIKAAFPFGVCFRAASLRCFSASDVSLFSRESRSFDEFFLLVIRFLWRERAFTFNWCTSYAKFKIDFIRQSKRASEAIPFQTAQFNRNALASVVMGARSSYLDLNSFNQNLLYQRHTLAPFDFSHTFCIDVQNFSH